MNEAVEKLVKSTIANVQKQYGKDSLMLLGDNPSMNVETFSSGSLQLDYALGGGIPRGRIIEVYGPESSGKTTLALHMIAEIQKEGRAAAFIDAEHALDPQYAANLGVNVSELCICQPDNGEQALGVVESILKNGGFSIIVIDSVAALVPKAELDGEMGSANIGLQARLMSQAMRKLTAVAADSKCTIVFINQIREKIGCMYGCLHADTMIPFTDGRSFPIRQIVDEKIQGEVWAYDEKAEKFVKKPIIDWHYNGEVTDNSDYIHIETGAFDSDNGTCGITVTPDHKIMTRDGWKSAKDITMKDSILSKYHSIINGTLEDFLYGTFAGDSTLSIRTHNTAALRFQDSNNEEYVNWKISKLSPFYSFKKTIVNQHVRYASDYSTELAIAKKIIGDRNPLVFLKYHFSNMGLALWYMDDGHYDSQDYHSRATISVKRIASDRALLKQIVDAFALIGLECTTDKDGALKFNKENTTKLFDMIAKYIPDCMAYKLDKAHQGKYVDFTLKSKDMYCEGYLPVKMIRTASDRQMRQPGKYDLTIKDCHNYIAGSTTDGLLVHNSPETTSGGRALKFYASVRLDVRKVETLKDSDKVAAANHVRVKVVKNKVAPPFRTAEFDIIFGKGISKSSEVAGLAVQMDIIHKAGGWFSYKDLKVQGFDAVRAALDNDPALMEEVTVQVKEILYSGKQEKLPDAIEDTDAEDAQ